MKNKKYYRGKRVLIIGKGNSGLECANEIMNEASYISCAGPTSINFAYKTHYVGHVRLINAIQIENYLLKQNASILDCHISKIIKGKKGIVVTVHYTHAKEEVEDIVFDEIIDATGFQSEKNCMINFELDYQQNEKFPILNKNFESVSIQNLFFSGAQTHGVDYRKTSGGFIHGFRYHSIVLGEHLARRIQPNIRFPIIGKSLTDFIIDRAQHSSALFLQPSFIIHVLKKQNGVWRDLGIKTIMWFNEYSGKDQVVGISLEYGDIQAHENILKVSRYPGEPDLSDHLHPVIRKKIGNRILTVHLEENLFNEFDNIINRDRLEKFMSIKKNKTKKVLEVNHASI